MKRFLCSDEVPLNHQGEIRVVSYNVLAFCHAKASTYGYCAPMYLKLQYRQGKLLEKLSSLRADVICLQDVDAYGSFWQPELQVLGYDGVYSEDKNIPSCGVAIFYLRETFQLFRSEVIDFDQVADYLNMGRSFARYLQHNTGLLLGLQPWEESTHPSAVCVSTACLVDPKGDPILMNLQRLQHLMLLRKLEAFNSCFHLPVILCGTFNCLPYSENYALLTTGAFPKQIATAAAIDHRPIPTVLGRSQIKLEWEKTTSLW